MSFPYAPRSRAGIIIAILLFARISLAATTIVHTVTATQSAAPTSTQWTDDTDFKNAVLNSTNFYRSQHNATALKWNDSLATYGQKWSNDCNFKHSGGPSGENLATGYPNVTASVEAWGNEGKSFNFKSGGFSEKTGHFTQLVWKGTTTVGCGKTYCGSGGGSGKAWDWYLVCEYYPPGNVDGGYKVNVQSTVNSGTAKTASRWIPIAMTFLMIFVL